MRTNQAGIDLVKSFEGLRLTAYQDVRGIWTIGYGTTGPWVHRGLTISPMEAEEKLKDHLLFTEKFVAKQIGEAPTTSGQFSAMVSFAYNVGVGNFQKSSVLKYHKSGKTLAAAAAFMMWVNAGKLKNVAGLIRRRNAERKLYVS